MSDYQKMVHLLCDATTMAHGKRKAEAAAMGAFRLSRSGADHQRGEEEISYALAYALSGGAIVNETLVRRTNRDRATECLRLTDKVGEITGAEGLQAQVSDALCHLMHLCRLTRAEDGSKIDFETELDSARNSFNVEVEEDPDQ